MYVFGVPTMIKSPYDSTIYQYLPYDLPLHVPALQMLVFAIAFIWFDFDI